MCIFIMFSPLKTSAVISQSPGKSLSPTQIVQSMFYNVYTVQKLKKNYQSFNIALVTNVRMVEIKVINKKKLLYY